jgi:hypothetical protein
VVDDREAAAIDNAIRPRCLALNLDGTANWVAPSSIRPHRSRREWPTDALDGLR